MGIVLNKGNKQKIVCFFKPKFKFFFFFFQIHEQQHSNGLKCKYTKRWWGGKTPQIYTRETYYMAQKVYVYLLDQSEWPPIFNLYSFSFDICNITLDNLLLDICKWEHSVLGECYPRYLNNFYFFLFRVLRVD